MKRKFIEKTFNERDSLIITISNKILDGYAAQGYDLSLRQLYYQLVSYNVLPNTNESYELLGRIISQARMAGLIDWDMITDRGRTTFVPQQWNSMHEAIEATASYYKLNKWQRQKVYIEVMVEKQALEGVLKPVCAKYGVNFTSNKGYSSMSALYETSLRLADAVTRGKEPVILYLGDLDPSGLDMTRDIKDRLSTFVGKAVDVKRLSLNKSQVDEYRLAPNPAKMSDSRAAEYVKKYGQVSWELDALPPKILASLVSAAIQRRIDKSLWYEDSETEKVHRATIQLAAGTLKKLEEKK